MKEQDVTLSYSLQAKPAALFVSRASQYLSTVKININSKTVNAKSIMGIISLGLTAGQTITVSAEGADEDKAVNELAEFLSKTSTD